MKFKQNQITVAAIIFFAILIVAGYQFYQYKQEKKSFSELSGLKYENLVTPEDQAPLVIPKSAILKGRTVKIPILMYHHVGDLPPKATRLRSDLTVSTSDFEQQVKWLSEQGFTSINLENIYQYSQHQFTLPKKPVVFTFDDGYDDVFLNAIPILKKYGFIGSFAIITQYPKTQLGDNFYASWQEIAQAQADGNEIVSHTQNHFDGTNKKFNADYIYQNLSGSIADIQNHLGLTTNILIYPYGHYNSTYIGQAKKAGFVMGVTVHEGSLINLDDLMQTPRIRVHGHEDFERFKRLVSD